MERCTATNEAAVREAGMIESFAPVAGPGARVLVLGSMPGQASLDAGQYYAYGHNAFWRIMGRLLNFDRDSKYEHRCALLTDNRIALWDVIATCKRPGSLDASIEPGTIRINDFGTFFSRNAAIGTVFFNGRKAESLFMKRVAPTLKGRSAMRFVALPSTSPAHAALRFEQKLEAWRQVVEAARGP